MSRAYLPLHWISHNLKSILVPAPEQFWFLNCPLHNICKYSCNVSEKPVTNYKLGNEYNEAGPTLELVPRKHEYSTFIIN